MEFFDNESRWAASGIDEALALAKTRQAQGLQVTLDALGEYAQNDGQAEENFTLYADCLKRAASNVENATFAVKLSALGLSLSEVTAAEKFASLTKLAESLKKVLEIDSEGTPTLAATVAIAQNAARSGFNLVLALQAYLDRTAEDIADSIAVGLKIRLVKGAYRGDTEDFAEIQNRFLNCFKILLRSEKPFDVGTHDAELLEAMTAMLDEQNRNLVCFGFLKGLGDETKLKMVEQGYRVSEYLPYGSNRRAYVARRLAYLKRLAALGRRPVP